MIVGGADCTLSAAMRPFVLAMAGPSKPPTGQRRGTKANGGSGSGDGNGRDRAREVALWAAVIGPIAAMVVGGFVILYEVLERLNNPAAFGVGLALVLGGKTADLLTEVLKGSRGGE